MLKRSLYYNNLDENRYAILNYMNEIGPGLEQFAKPPQEDFVTLADQPMAVFYVRRDHIDSSPQFDETEERNIAHVGLVHHYDQEAGHRIEAKFMVGYYKRKIEEGCKERGIPYVDTGANVLDFKAVAVGEPVWAEMGTIPKGARGAALDLGQWQKMLLGREKDEIKLVPIGGEVAIQKSGRIGDGTGRNYADMYMVYDPDLKTDALHSRSNLAVVLQTIRREKVVLAGRPEISGPVERVAYWIHELGVDVGKDELEKELILSRASALATLGQTSYLEFFPEIPPTMDKGDQQTIMGKLRMEKLKHNKKYNPTEDQKKSIRNWAKNMSEI